MVPDTFRAVDVVLFLPSLEGGGAERVMLDLAAGLNDEGVNVVLLLAASGQQQHHGLPDGVSVVHLGARRVATSLLALWQYLRRHRPAAVLSTLEHANVVALLATRFVPGIRVCVREANTLSRDLLPSSVQSRVLLMLMKLLYSRADAVIAVSQGVGRELRSRLGVPEARLHVINNPVITDRVLEGSLKPLSHPWFAAGEPPVLLGVGRLTTQKDFASLLRAFARVRQQRPCRLIILGDGELRSELEELARSLHIAPDVEFPGFVSNPFPYMSLAKLFVLSSAWEGLPNVLIQALALGTPVVSTDCPSGPYEILDGGRHGRLVPVGDDILMSEAIIDALDQPHTAPPQGWLDRYRHGVIVQQYLQVLKPAAPAK